MFLNRKIKLKFIYSRKQIQFVIVVFLLTVLSVGLGSETYKITTYYPAPYGSYQKSRALDRAKAGNLAAVQLGNNIFTGGVHGTIRTPEISTAAVGGDIIFAPAANLVQTTLVLVAVVLHIVALPSVN